MAYYEVSDKEEWAKTPTAIHGSIRLVFRSLEKATAIATCLENQFTHQDLCDENHKQQVKARIKALFEAADHPPPPGKIRLRDIEKLIKSLKLRKACGTDGIPNDCLRQLPRRPLVHLTFI
jgi:hypothetical protein